ncbi:deacylase [Desulfovibrio sp. OttesenSCG-928-F07]|nr:deacylase [Desulfovibrio sp. OttesenSCG-928-F07]
MKHFFTLIFLIVFCLSSTVLSAAPEKLNYQQMPAFTLHKKESGTGNTLLVIGGIQGDEPGGFSAASLLATHYTIKSGNVWIVPNLNFASIIHSSRGLHGDMNRKFAKLSPKDPEYETVRNIQEIILNPQVDLVLNMHDGSGYYRPKWENSLKNPQRWGQCIVIDQEKIDDDVVQNPRFQDLVAIANNVKDDVNVKLLRYLHSYRIKNTTTKNFDKEMEKSLSYFAVCAGKAAFGIEASKELPAASRVYYHVCLLEAFMREMGIEFERNFHLSPNGVAMALNENISISLFNKRTVFSLNNARSTTRGYIPVQKGAALVAEPSNPLLAVLPHDNEPWSVVYGNRTLTRFTPEYLNFDTSIEKINLLIDGKQTVVNIGDMIKVNSSFIIQGEDGYRVNAIGAVQEVNGSEADVELKYEHFAKRFSLDQAGYVYRVEFYKDSDFCGMLLVNFGPDKKPALPKIPLTAGNGPIKSNLGK